jgi:hypothetical protein
MQPSMVLVLFIKTTDICVAVDFLLSLSLVVALKKVSFESIMQVWL